MKPIIIFLNISLCVNVLSQSTFTNQNNDYFAFADRFEVLSGKITSEAFTAFKPYRRDHVLRSIERKVSGDSVFGNLNILLSKRDFFNYGYIKEDNWDLDSGIGSSVKPVLKYFYEKKNALYAVDHKDFKLVANPLLSVWVGKEGSSDKTYNYLNSRGVELRGNIDDRIGFYTYFTDNQAILPKYVRESMLPIDTLKLVLMGENYIKTPKSGAVDYISARGYVTFNVTKHIGLQFGHDKNFIGNGYRSLILSDNSGAYNFLKLQTKIWKIQYTNLFCQLTAIPTTYDSYFPKKYFALHHLSTNIGKHLNVGLFESVMYGNRGEGFDVNYLNPIIFYRSIEQNLGSADNAFLGGDWKLNFMKHFSWYGQVMIDEFLIANVRSHNGSWTNKQAVQTGLKYFNAFGVKNFDLHGEVNIVRPYTYAHLDNYRNYSNYLQPLAHPRGANFKEFVGIVKYQPINRLSLTGKLIILKQGLDSLHNKLSTGSDILMDYSKRISHNGQTNLGHVIGQGIATTLVYFEMGGAYMLKHNVFLDLSLVYRKQSSALQAYNYSRPMVTMGLRVNMARKSFDW